MGANLKEVRNRISSVQSTQQITNAMKMVSAAKLSKATEAIVQMRPYSNKLNEMLTNLLSNMEGDASGTFGVERPIERVLIAVITSTRGLCGGFNANIIKEVRNALDKKYASQYEAGKVSLLFIGKKGYDFFKNNYTKCIHIMDHIELNNKLEYSEIEAVANYGMDKFEVGKYDTIDIAYSSFKNAGTQIPSFERFLPVAKKEGKKEGPKADYIFEPDKLTLLNELIPSILKTQLQKCIYDNQASEHGARMTAMDKATENAKDMIKDLKIEYNKARQEAITNEISEIVGGAAALQGN